VIGVLSGFTQQVNIPSLFAKNLHVIGLSVGSRKMFENTALAIGRNRIKPVVDRTAAYATIHWQKARRECRAFSYCFFFCASDRIRSSNFRNSAVSSSMLLEGRFWKGITSDKVEPPLGVRPRCAGHFAGNCRISAARRRFAGAESATIGGGDYSWRRQGRSKNREVR
jgi:hypothetical protein